MKFCKSFCKNSQKCKTYSHFDTIEVSSNETQKPFDICNKHPIDFWFSETNQILNQYNDCLIDFISYQSNSLNLALFRACFVKILGKFSLQYINKGKHCEAQWGLV